MHTCTKLSPYAGQPRIQLMIIKWIHWTQLQRIVINLWFKLSYISSRCTRLAFNQIFLLTVISICCFTLHLIKKVILQSFNWCSQMSVYWSGMLTMLILLSKAFWYKSEWFAVSTHIALNLLLRYMIMFCTQTTR